jgi:hypothetical protein
VTKLIVAFRNFANAPKNLVCNTHKTDRVFVKITSQLMFCGKTMLFLVGITWNKNTPCGQNEKLIEC